MISVPWDEKHLDAPSPYMFIYKMCVYICVCVMITGIESLWTIDFGKRDSYSWKVEGSVKGCPGKTYGVIESWFMFNHPIQGTQQQINKQSLSRLVNASIGKCVCVSWIVSSDNIWVSHWNEDDSCLEGKIFRRTSWDDMRYMCCIECVCMCVILDQMSSHDNETKIYMFGHCSCLIQIWRNHVNILIASRRCSHAYVGWKNV